MNKAFITVTAALCGLVFTGCAHNARGIAIGTGLNFGYDPNSGKFGAQYYDGVALVDVARENSSVEMEVDSTIGLAKDADGNVKGIRKIKTEIGPQITGYLVDLAANDKELAKAYVESMKYYWQYKANNAEPGIAVEKPVETIVETTVENK